MVKERNRLDCLAKTHFICKDRVPLLIPGFDQPIHRVELIWSEQFVILINWLVLNFVLRRIFLGTHIIKVQLILQIGKLKRRGEPTFLFGIELQINKHLMFLPLTVHRRPCLPAKSLVYHFKLIDFLRTCYDSL